MAKENKSRYVILGMLTHQPMSGYDIKKCIGESISYFWDMSYGQIYPELSNLEKEGLAVKTVETNDKNPDKKVYSITEKGLEVFKKWLENPVEEEKLKYEILVKVFFGSQIPAEKTIEQIQKFRDRNQKNIDMMGIYEKELNAHIHESPDHLYFLLTVLLGKKVYQAQNEWAKEAIEIINKMNQGGIQ